MHIVELLLIEDNPGDVELVRDALRESRVVHNLHVAEDGDQAIQFLRKVDPFSEAPRPDLILLDLNLPGRDGREILSEIKSDQNLAGIPVVVLTTSEAEEDVLRSYNLQASAFVTKPFHVDQFIERVRSIGDFFFRVSRLPRRPLTLRDLLQRADHVCHQILEHLQQDYIPVAEEYGRLLRPDKKSKLVEVRDITMVNSTRQIDKTQRYLTELFEELEDYAEEIKKRARE